MRDITKTVYRFDELTATAKERAVAAVCERAAGPWWDSVDTEDIAETIVFELAAALGSPGFDTYGPGDFPGIDSVTLEAWDVDRLDLAIRGTLTRETAPKLPWVDGLDSVDLAAGRSATAVTPLNADEAPASQHEHNVMTVHVLAALERAIRAGRDEYEYKTGEESARDWCENNVEQEYDEDGNLA